MPSNKAPVQTVAGPSALRIVAVGFGVLAGLACLGALAEGNGRSQPHSAKRPGFLASASERWSTGGGKQRACVSAQSASAGMAAASAELQRAAALMDAKARSIMRN